MILFDHLSNAYHSLQRNRGRTFLTSLGIAIGVASVTAVLALSDGVAGVVDHQVATLDNNLGIIRPGLQTKDPNSLASPVTQYTFSTSTLTETDLTGIAALPTIDAAAPIMTIDGTLRAGGATSKNNVVVATTPDFSKVSGIEVRDGQFLDSTTERNTAILGPQLAIDLFGTDHPLGQQFTLRGNTFTIIGILKSSDAPINFNNIDFNQAAIINLEVGKTFHEGRAQIQQINFRAKTSAALPQTAAQVRELLTKNHQNEEDFTVTTGKDIGKPTSQLFQAMRDVMTIIAAISLFVGGIGIMNIMLVGVAERTREIGIRKAVGASNRAIVSQFLTESLLLSLAGGILGYLLGYIGAFIICTFLFFSPAITWQIALTAAIMAIGIGVVFGIYPAIRAARKNVIESLQQYH